jgi:hypothetical protein
MSFDSEQGQTRLPGWRASAGGGGACAGGGAGRGAAAPGSRPSTPSSLSRPERWFPASASRTCAPRGRGGAIRAALGQVSPRTRAVTLVLPDTVVRVFVLDFDSLPGKAAEAFSVLRFRLRKMVPFDVEHAGLSYQVLTESKTECKVLAAVMPGPILAEYEAAVRAAGYEPGAVLPSSLAALAGLDSMEAVLAANLSGMALTTTITNGHDLLLYRTLDLPESPACASMRCSAASPWPPPFMRTSSAPGPESCTMPATVEQAATVLWKTLPNGSTTRN